MDSDTANACSDAGPTVGIVIPFFQRDQGILARALKSVAAQTFGTKRLYVVIVDDGSPWSAAQELRAHPAPDGLDCQVIVQPNAGPGAARNTGLQALRPGTEVVAFLDSDDEWDCDHLQRSVKALQAGYTACFANLYHPGSTIDEFTRGRAIESSRHPVLDADPALHGYSGDMVHQITTANVIYMTTLVVSVPALGHVRFQETFRRAGEDYLYWLDLDAAGARFAFSSLPGARRGRGVNLWDNNGWGTDGLAQRVLDETRYRQQALVRYARSDETRRALRRDIGRLRQTMVRDALHRLRRGKPVQWGVVWDLMRETTTPRRPWSPVVDNRSQRT